jgi:hypothetical protein
VSTEPRAHHYVPQCWLAGFTEQGEKDSELWVTDLKRQKQWKSNPVNAGHRRDFYRISDPNLDPVMVEKTLSKIEDSIAPLLKSLDRERREPTKDEMEALVSFMAVQWARVPAFRPTVLAITDSFLRSEFSTALKTRESWAAALKEAGIPANSPGADYDNMREYDRSGQYSLSAETEWYLQRAFSAVESITPLLRNRYWTTLFSSTGSFVASDNPIVLDGPKGQKIGFKNAEVIIYPLSRHIFLCGTNGDVRPPFVNRKYIAAMNTLMMLGAEAQVYSHLPDFCFLDEARKYQTDWKLFSKERILENIPDSRQSGNNESRTTLFSASLKSLC